MELYSTIFFLTYPLGNFDPTFCMLMDNINDRDEVQDRVDIINSDEFQKSISIFCLEDSIKELVFEIIDIFW